MAPVVTTTSIQKRAVLGSFRMVFSTLAFDTGDYAAGGVAVTAGQFGLNRIQEIIFPGAAVEVSATPTAQIPRFNPTTSKVEIFQSATADAPFAEKGAEAFGAGASVRVIVIGQ
jgi:hypothetical protein